MAAQGNAPHPMTPVVILTRPAAQARRFAASLRRAVPGLRVMVAPLMEEVLLAPALEIAGRAVIFTSETGVRAAARLIPQDLRGEAHCVGPRTAAAARRAGFTAHLAGSDAATLVAALARPGPPLIHLRGLDARGDVAARLTQAGRPTLEAIVYRQDECPLSPRATAALTGAAPVLVPVFSPRSARLLRQAVGTPGGHVTLAALSPAVAAELGPSRQVPGQVQVATRPDGPAMVALIAAWAKELRLTHLAGPQADEDVRPGAMESES